MQHDPVDPLRFPEIHLCPLLLVRAIPLCREAQRHPRLPRCKVGSNPFPAPVIGPHFASHQHRRAAPRRWLSALVIDTNLPPVAVFGSERRACIAHGNTLIRYHLSAVPQVALIRLQQFFRTREQNLVGALTLPANRTVLELPREPWFGHIDADRVFAELAAQFGRLRRGFGHQLAWRKGEGHQNKRHRG